MDWYLVVASANTLPSPRRRSRSSANALGPTYIHGSGQIGTATRKRTGGTDRSQTVVHPFRQMLPRAERCQVSSVRCRADRILDGVTLDDVEGPWRFDKRLRPRIVDGLKTLEVGLRTQIALVLGARDTFGHLNGPLLDADSCGQPGRGSDGASNDVFEAWSQRYDKLQRDAKNEDYVKHHLAKYGQPLPVWVAVQSLDFGALSRLYDLLDRRDQNAITRELGLSSGTGLAHDRVYRPPWLLPTWSRTWTPGPAGT